MFDLFESGFDITPLLQDSQIDDVQGLSRFFTLHIHRRIDKFAQLNNYDNIENIIKDAIISQVMSILIRYGDGDDLNNNAAVIALGFKNAMVRKINIRPISIVNHTNNQQVEAARMALLGVDAERNLEKEFKDGEVLEAFDV